MKSKLLSISFIFFLICFLSSCISNKKHIAAVDLLKAEADALLQQEVDLREVQIKKANQQITDLNLQLAERKGENNILVQLREELQNKVLDLESQIENLSSRSSSTQQNLNSNLQKKDQEINRLNNLIKQVDGTLDRHTALLAKVASDLRYELQNINPTYYDQFKFEVESGLHQVKVHVLSEIIFKPKSVTRMQDEGIAVFEKISEVLQRYPNMAITVIGHTDSTPAKKRDVDNWNVGAQQAATVLRLLTEDLDLSPSAVMLGSKGEYAPRESNATQEGKNKNRRIEIVLAPRSEDLVKAIRKVIE